VNLRAPVSQIELIRSLRAEDLSEEIVQRLVQQARPALALETTEIEEEELPVGESKFGGSPDLPSSIEWPVRPPYSDSRRRAAAHRKKADELLAEAAQPKSWVTREDAEQFQQLQIKRAAAVRSEFPLSFVAQLDLASLSKMPGFDASLPKKGRLLLFFDCFEMPSEYAPSSAAGFRLLWDQSPVGSLERKSVPEELEVVSTEDSPCIFHPAQVTPHSILTPIPLSDLAWDAFPLDDIETHDIYDDWLREFGMPDQADGINHRLGGWPIPLRHGMQVRTQLAANGIDCGTVTSWETEEIQQLAKSADEWRLLLQVGCDETIGLLPEGDGCLYVLMREQDIKARDFDRAWVVFQRT
jgi:uncharacterized protein YwqG